MEIESDENELDSSTVENGIPSSKFKKYHKIIYDLLEEPNSSLYV